MGGSNSRAWPHVLQTSTEGGENDRIKYAASSCQGRRQYMEDAHAVVPNLDDNTSFFGVYDGHGGAEVALLCARLFHTELRNHPDYQNNFMMALKCTFFRMDEVLLQSDEWKELIKPRGDCIQFLKPAVCANYWPIIQSQTTPYVAPQRTGSTACIVVIRGNQIMIGNVGDSLCVLSSNGQAIQLTTDHKPNEVIEKQRIRRAGGRVTREMTPIITRGHWEVLRMGSYRINGVLAVSRVIGDFEFKQNNSLPPEEQAATCNPDLISMDIDNEMEFLVIASDSIWDCMSTKGVVNYVRTYLRSGTHLGTICKMLVRRALPSEDNVTVILVQFKSSADRLPPLTESDGGVRQAGAATSGNSTERTLTTLVDDGEDDDDDPAPPALVRRKKKEQQDGEAGGSERHLLLGSSSSTETTDE